MMETLTNQRDRLFYFLKTERISKSEFCEKLKKSRGWLSSMGEFVPSSTLAETIKIYPQLNIYWILSGEGSMYGDHPHTGFSVDDLTAQQIADITKETLLEMFKQGEVVSGTFHKQMVSELTARIAELESEVTALTDELEQARHA